MIIGSITDVKNQVSIAQSFQYEDLLPSIKQALNKFTRKYVGYLDVTLAETQTGTNAEIKNEARDYLQNAIVNFALFLYVPIGSVQFDSSGISSTANDNRSAVAYGEKRDLMRYFLDAGHEAMDLLLAFMERNKAVFADWAESEYYTESKELLVSSTGTFGRYYNIFESRQTYLALKPSLRLIEDKYIKTFLCHELIKHLKTETLTEVQLQVKENLQAAIVAFTIAKVVKEGIFVIDASSIKLRFDSLSTDKTQSPDYGKPADFLTETAKNQTANGENYLKMVKDIITAAAPTEFNQCEFPIIPAASNGGYQPYNTQSVLGL